ncbi:FMN reductase [Angustibacter sp. McL0619]|uniref:FMN reductase n=1 Tax=Angustibacter sp. McL0619 TaxID=3415676 RepID=UPI003CF3FACC
MSTRSLVVVTAGLSQPSSTRLLADRLAAATSRAMAERGEAVDVRVVELRELANELTNHLLTGFPSGALAEAVEAVRTADALIAVTPIFNASYSGLFKTFFDVLDEGSLDGVPVLLAATGGTARHSLAVDFAMRPLFAYLRADAVATGVFAASEDWGSAGRHGPLGRRIERAGGELAAAVAGRPRVQRVDPFDEPTPFEQLLAGG